MFICMYVYIMFVYIMYYSTLTLTVLRISGITNFAMFSIAQIWRCAVYTIVHAKPSTKVHTEFAKQMQI